MSERGQFFLIFRNSVWGHLELTRIGMDIPDNIPSNPTASGPPTATPRTDPAASRAPLDLMEEAAAEHPGWAESAQIYGFPGNLEKS